ncbi:MAG TPA: hypothetical protein VG708_01775 [Mycobacteriales bacterium]|jgi:hypothetical protein|nr:hypothetical protein [Mycobacteriales bacterium]
MLNAYTGSLAALPTSARPRLLGAIPAVQGIGVSTAAMTANAGARKNDATGGPAFEDPV